MLKNIVIVGAGISGEIIGREIINSPDTSLIGYIDDDPRKKENSLNDKPILGEISQLPDILNEYEIHLIILSIPSADGEKIKDILRHLIHRDIQIQIVPGYYDIFEQDTKIDYPIRDIDVSDLLGKETTRLDLSAVTPYLYQKRILITGAGGSIGSELAKLIASTQPECLILLGRGENSIFEVNNELQHLYPDVKKIPVITNITDYSALEDVFLKHRPQVVFHAAAHKHVHLMESHIKEVFKNNVIGSKNLMDLSVKYSVERFIMISSDKAVKPKSLMGLTKRITEMLMSHYAKPSDMVFCAVRFGNVLGSRGSVLPLFKEQIRRGGPVTVTHKDVIRYFMTIPQASQLVLQAAAMAKGNEIFVLNMGEPIKIYELAKLLIQLYRPNPGKDVTIRFTGLRPGEKLEEELWTHTEKANVTQKEDIYMLHPDPPSEDIVQVIEDYNDHLKDLSPESLKAMLFQLVEPISQNVLARELIY